MDTVISDVTIANLALTGLGVKHIEDFLDNTEQARTMNSVYPIFRNELLACHPWGFAIERVALGLLSTPPLYGYTNAFQIPTDCLRILESSIDEDGYPWVREGDKIYTDVDSISIKYIKQVEDPTKFSPAFINAFSAKLEAEICVKLTSDSKLAQLKYTVYIEKLRLAKGTDSQENRSLKDINSNEWLNSRESGRVS